jgi:hypothetical protein
MGDHPEKEIIMAASRGSTIRNVVLVHGLRGRIGLAN